MTIRLTGKDALAEARYADINPEVLVNTKFYNEQNGRHSLLDPHEALELVERGTLKPEDLSCEALSVWEHLQRAGGASGFLLIHPGSKTILVLTRDHGSRLAEGIRGFAVLPSVFESAGWWAKNSPMTDPDLDWEEFIGRLQPRLPLQKQACQHDGETRRHAREIAESLIDLFRLDTDSVREDLQAKEVLTYGRELKSYGGDLLDIVLERIRKIPFNPEKEAFPWRETLNATLSSTTGNPG